MTYGAIRLFLTQLYPGLNPDLIDGWIQQRYTSILDQLSWSRLRVDAILETTAPYSDGTVAVTAGSVDVTLTGGTWTAPMTGRSFRVSGRSEFYGFTQTGDATGTLDRPYEGDTAAVASYSLFQRIYTLPAACRVLDDDAFSGAVGRFRRLSRAQLDDAAPNRPTSGTPQIWASSFDANSAMQVELYPIPGAAIGVPYTYTADPAELSGTGTAILVWVRPAALIAGVHADILNHLDKPAAADRAEAKYLRELSTMRATEARRDGPSQMSLASHYTSHRARRWR
jgi:hypothetical protein